MISSPSTGDQAKRLRDIANQREWLFPDGRIHADFMKIPANSCDSAN